MSSEGHVFISYSRANSAIVDRMVASLLMSKYRVWIDRQGMFGGRLWRPQVAAAIKHAAVILVVLSHRSVGSKPVRQELELSDAYDKRILPVHIDIVSVPDELELLLTGLHFIRWHALLDFEAGMEEIRRALDGLGVQPSAQTPAAVGPPAADTGRGRWLVSPALLCATGLAGAVSIHVMERWQVQPWIAGLSLGLGTIQLSSLLLALAFAPLSAFFILRNSLRPAIAGLGMYLGLTVPVASASGQYLVAYASALASIALCAAWAWKARPRTDISPLLGQALVLLGVVLAGGLLHCVDGRRFVRPTITVAAFDVSDDESLEDKRLEHSNRVRRKLSAVLSGTDLDVVPDLFDAKSMEEWSFDTLRVRQVRQLASDLLLRTTLNSCRNGPDGTAPQTYVWLTEPYSADFVPLFRIKSLDSRVMVLRLALQLMTDAPPVKELPVEQRVAIRRVILDEIRRIAAEQGQMEVASKAGELMRADDVAGGAVRELLDSVSPDATACDEFAKASRNAIEARAKSYAKPRALRTPEGRSR